MKNSAYIAAGIAALLSTSALAEEIASIADISNMKNKSEITISGVVDSVENEREFTLRDKMDKTIDVNITSNESVTFKEGDSIKVSGTVDRGLIGTDINARSVEVEIDDELMSNAKDGAREMSGTSDNNAQLSKSQLNNAQSFNIGQLPDAGTVKVTGQVTNVEDEKEFTLSDNTGSIKVDIISAENAAITKGAKVTVIGNVEKGMMGKGIEASEVMVISDTSQSIND
jgi:uncharacterized protein YdeI (BOF family)